MSSRGKFPLVGLLGLGAPCLDGALILVVLLVRCLEETVASQGRFAVVGHLGLGAPDRVDVLVLVVLLVLHIVARAPVVVPVLVVEGLLVVRVERLVDGPPGPVSGPARGCHRCPHAEGEVVVLKLVVGLHLVVRVLDHVASLCLVVLGSGFGVSGFSV